MNDNTTLQVPFWLDTKPVTFPPSDLALTEPNGLLAVGGDLTSEWLLMAYSKGIFPWFNPGEPILWWTPDPRSVLYLEDIKIRRSLRQSIKKLENNHALKVTFDCNFKDVILACAQVPREGQAGTWITHEMLTAYQSLHKAGHAHSVEVWADNELVGGLYGVAIGKMFFGESMFAKRTDTSKIALVALGLQLQQWGFKLIDTQVETQHLNSLGAFNIPRYEFEKQIKQQCALQFPPHKWHLDEDWQTWIRAHLSK